MTKAITYYTLPEVVKMTGQSYDRIHYLTLTRPQFKPAKQYGRTRLFTWKQVEELKTYCELKGVNDGIH